MVTGFTLLSRLTQIAPPSTRFVLLGAGICLGLPSHPASRRRSCLRLGVSTTSSSRGLTPPSDRPCRAYPRRRRCAAPRAQINHAHTAFLARQLSSSRQAPHKDLSATRAGGRGTLDQ